MNFKLLSALFAAATLTCAVVACSSDDDDDSSSCGAATCQTTAGTCVAPVCSNGKYVCPANTTQVALTPTSCQSSDAGTCAGAVPTTTVCKSVGGLCSDMVCSGGTYACPTGSTETTPADCDADAAAPDGGCGEPLAGATCQTVSGTCMDLVCMDGTYMCPPNTTQVGLTPSNCAGFADGSADASDMTDASDASNDH